jgi:hypothetical protein
MNRGYYNTSTEEIGKQKLHYCIYCGKRCSPEIESEGYYDTWTYYLCDCDLAKQELQLQLEINKLQSQFEQKQKELENFKFNNTNNTLLNDIEYEIKLKELNEEFNKN